MRRKTKVLQARVIDQLYRDVSAAASENGLSTTAWMTMILKREAARTLLNKERQRVVHKYPASAVESEAAM